ncbi:MAG: PQQ-binding-like beta-propeller repeat protein [Chthoniobacteraceae bacterium]
MIRSLLLLTLISPALAADWPEFMGPNRDQTSAETGLRDTLPAPIVWSREVGTGYSAPSIRDGRLVLHHRVGDEEVVESLDPKTGKPGWRHGYPCKFVDPFGFNNGPRCSPLLTADRCYTFGADGVLLCLDLATGAPVWRRDTQKDFEVPDAFFGVGSSPILEGDKLIVQVGAQPNSGVVAFDAKTGKTLWENVGEKTWTGVPMTGWPGERLVQWNRSDPTYEKQASYCTPVAATIHGKRHVLVVTRQGLVSLDPATGAVNFSYWFRVRQNESVNAMTPVVKDDVVFLSTAYYRGGSVLVRVAPDGRSVSEVWKGLQLEVHWTTPVLTAGHLFAFTGRNEPDGIFRCVELATGAVKWERDERWRKGGHGPITPGTEPDVFARGSAILADGKLIALGEAGLLGIFKADAAKCDELARWQVPGLTYPTWAAPVLSDKQLYLRGENRLVCLDFARTP